jgi:hypothetical protein
MGFNWNPISWLKDATDEADKIGHDLAKIWSWVEREVIKLGDDISGGINDVYNYTDTQLTLLGGAVDALYRDVSKDAGKVGGDITKFIKDGERDIRGWVDDAVHDIEKVGGSLWHDIQAGIRDAERWSDSGLSWFYHHIVLPGEHDLHREIDEVGHELTKVGDELWHDVILKAAHDAEEAYHDAQKALYWIDHAGYDAVRLVEESWDWLERFARNPLESLEGLPKAVVEQMDTSWAKTAAAETTSIWGPIEKELGQVFNE